MASGPVLRLGGGRDLIDILDPVQDQPRSRSGPERDSPSVRERVCPERSCLTQELQPAIVGESFGEETLHRIGRPLLVEQLSSLHRKEVARPHELQIVHLRYHAAQRRKLTPSTWPWAHAQRARGNARPRRPGLARGPRFHGVTPPRAILGLMDRIGYAERRPYAVPRSLADLGGPAHGVIRLPAAMAWTGRTEYDLDDDADLVVFYERVLVEATDTAVLESLLDAGVLRGCWRQLFLPAAVRRTWEQRFTDLATAA